MIVELKKSSGRGNSNVEKSIRTTAAVLYEDEADYVWLRVYALLKTAWFTLGESTQLHVKVILSITNLLAASSPL
jgi:hypothetical protein